MPTTMISPRSRLGCHLGHCIGCRLGHRFKLIFLVTIGVSRANAGLSQPTSAYANRHIQDTCSAKENGLELFPVRDPKDQKMKLVQKIDTNTCTYELALSFKPDKSIPFIDYPTRPLPDKPNTTIFKDVPPNFHTVCDSQGFDETKTGTSGSPLSPTNHVGLNTHYTEYSYTIYTDDDVAKKTGFKDVVLGAAPCGQGIRKFPSHSVHFYTKSNRDERINYRCFTGGGFFCKPVAQQCSDRAKKFQMDGSGLMCNAGANFTVFPLPDRFPFFKNLPPGWVWTVDSATRPNTASASQGLHAVYLLDFAFETLADIPQHLLLNYDGELVANHVIMWSGFSKGLSRGYKFTRELNFDDAKDTSGKSCRPDKLKNMASAMTTEYNPDTGRTTVTARGRLKDCSGPSFTKVIDHSEGDGAVPEPEGTCGHKRFSILESPTFIKRMKFENSSAAALHRAGDYDVYQDFFFTWEEITDPYNGYMMNTIPAFPTFVPFGLVVGKPLEIAGVHSGIVNFIRDETGQGPSALGGGSNVIVAADIKFNHTKYGHGTIKAWGYCDVFGEGEFSITGGTGDFEGAYGTIKPTYGLLLFDKETIDKGVATINPDFIAGLTLKNETLQFGNWLKFDFKCGGVKTADHVRPSPKPTSRPTHRLSKSSKHGKAVKIDT